MNFVSQTAFNLNAPVNAKEVGRELKKLGHFTPKQIVEVAKAPRHPLHKYFEWDDSKAAHAFRLSQARDLVLSIGIEQDGQFIRSFESVVIDKHKMYVPMEEISKAPELVDQVMQRAMSELLFWRAKHSRYQTFFGGIFSAIDVAEEKLRMKHGNSKGKEETRSRKAGKVRNPANKKTLRKHNNHRGLTPTN